MIATDGVMVGAKPAPRTYGTYPRILGEFVREERWLGLEEAVHKMTGASAARLGLADRGDIADGLAGGPRRLRPGPRARARHLRRAAPLPRGHPVRARQRRRS